jgi:hypothetical protein
MPGAAVTDAGLLMVGNGPPIAAQGALCVRPGRTDKSIIFRTVLAPHIRIAHRCNSNARTLLAPQRSNVSHNLPKQAG